MNRFASSHPRNQGNRASPQGGNGGGRFRGNENFGRAGGRRSAQSTAPTTHPTRDFSTSRGRGGRPSPYLSGKTDSVPTKEVQDLKMEVAAELKPAAILIETMPKGILKTNGTHPTEMNGVMDIKNVLTNGTRGTEMNNAYGNGTHPATASPIVNGNGREAKTVTFDPHPVINGWGDDNVSIGQSDVSMESALPPPLVNGGRSGLQMFEGFSEVNRFAVPENANHVGGPTLKQIVEDLSRNIAAAFNQFADALEKHSAQAHGGR